MDIDLTLGAIERFEDESGVGLISLVEGTDQSAIKARWTVRRLRMLLRTARQRGVTDAEIETALAPRRLVETQMRVVIQIIDQLSPPEETSEFMGGEDGVQEGGASTGK